MKKIFLIAICFFLYIGVEAIGGDNIPKINNEEHSKNEFVQNKNDNALIDQPTNKPEDLSDDKMESTSKKNFSDKLRDKKKSSESKINKDEITTPVYKVY